MSATPLPVALTVELRSRLGAVLREYGPWEFDLAVPADAGAEVVVRFPLRVDGEPLELEALLPTAPLPEGERLCLRQVLTMDPQRMEVLTVDHDENGRMKTMRKEIYGE